MADDPRCDGYFLPEEYDIALVDSVVHRVRSDPALQRDYKTQLIKCWFREVFNPRFPSSTDTAAASKAQANWIASQGATSIEEIMAR